MPEADTNNTCPTCGTAIPEGAPDVYLSVMHSGVTLCPVVGRLASLEILDRVDVDLLKHYRYERFGADPDS